MKTDKIFVQIASYRDPQLVPTLRSLFENAKHPERFNIGICWQHDETESLEEFEDHPNVTYLDYHYSDSQGLGWARSEVSKLWNNEGLTLQFDSHHRFLKNWDVMMLDDYAQCWEYSDYPILTTYLTPFQVSDWENEPQNINPTPTLMSQYEFSNDKLLMSMPWYIQDYKERTSVIKARTISGHFYLADSDFINRVPYDPEIYFGGYCEEATMSVRAWTHGYDFFSPYRQYIWHEYTREGRPKHWEDHGTESKTGTLSNERDGFARKKTRQLFGQEDNEIDISRKYGLGKVRSLRDYEIYTGLDFKNCKIQDYTLKVKQPPNPIETEDDKEIDVKVFWDVDHFKERVKDNSYKFITFGVIDKDEKEIYRNDFTPDKDKDVFNYKVNSHVVKIKKGKVKGSRVVMFGMLSNDQWTDPLEMEL